MMPISAIDATLRVVGSYVTKENMECIFGVNKGRFVAPDAQHQEARYSIEYDLDGNVCEIDEIIGGLCSVVEAANSRLMLLPDEAETDIWLTIYYSGEFAGFCIDRNLITRLSNIQVNLVFSIYQDS